MKTRILGGMCAFLLYHTSFAQLVVQGSLDSQFRRYQAWGQELRQPPNAYFLSGRMVWRWGEKIKIPVTFSLTNQRVIVGVPSLQVPRRWAQSFNRLSFQPKWKDHQFYVGTHALTFSPYTLAGHRAQGIGYVYRSSKSPFYGGIQGGQLLQRVLPDSLGVSRPAYARWGGSAKLGYQHAQGFVEISHLSSSDVWQGDVWDRLIPEKNQASSLSVQQKLAESWRLNALYGRSVISRFGGGDLWEKQKARQAWKLEALYQAGAWEGGMAYAHTDPQFRTHGAYLINQDLDTYSGHGLWRQDWGEIRGETGVEQSTRQSQRLSRETRWVNRWHAQGQWESGWTADVGWSNFTSIANLRPELLYLQALESWHFVDTLNFRQMNQQWTSQVGYQVPTASKEISTTVSLQGQWQQGRDTQGEQAQETRIFSSQASLSRANTARKSSWQASVQALQTVMGNRAEWMAGPQVHWKSPIGKDRWELMGQVAQNQFWSEGQSTRQLWTALLGCSARFGDQHRLSLQGRWMHQKGLEWGQLSEQTITLSYQYQWNLTLIPLKP